MISIIRILRKRYSKNLKPVQIYMSSKLIAMLDYLVIEGYYRSRSEIVRYAVIDYIYRNHRELIKW